MGEGEGGGGGGGGRGGEGEGSENIAADTDGDRRTITWNLQRFKRAEAPVTRRTHAANNLNERLCGMASLVRRREVSPGAIRRMARGKKKGK